MEEAMNKFDSMVGSAEERLENIEKKIDSEFSKQLESEDDSDQSEDQESLLEKLKEIRSEYSSLCQEAVNVSKVQREMAKVFQQELLTQVKNLQVLQDRGFGEKNVVMDEEASSAINSLVQQSEVAENLSQRFKKS